MRDPVTVSAIQKLFVNQYRIQWQPPGDGPQTACTVAPMGANAAVVANAAALDPMPQQRRIGIRARLARVNLQYVIAYAPECPP
jgi:hypothetical protein